MQFWQSHKRRWIVIWKDKEGISIRKSDDHNIKKARILMFYFFSGTDQKLITLFSLASLKHEFIYSEQAIFYYHD